MFGKLTKAINGLAAVVKDNVQLARIETKVNQSQTLLEKIMSRTEEQAAAIAGIKQNLADVGTNLAALIARVDAAIANSAGGISPADADANTAELNAIKDGLQGVEDQIDAAVPSP